MRGFFYHSITNPQYYKAALIACDVAKLELFGDEYITEWLHQYSIERAYKVYVTDILKIIAENTAKFCGGSVPTVRYADLIEPKPKDTRSTEEVIADVNRKCGLTMIDDTGGE